MIGAYTLEKVQEPGLYLLALVVGLLINAYGQLLVPILRDIPPFHALRVEARERPRLLGVSVFVAFAFPFLVALISGVATRYQQRGVEALAALAAHQPNPGFRVDLRGRWVQLGPAMARMLADHPSPDAPGVLGDGLWTEVRAAAAAGRSVPPGRAVHYGGTCYHVAHSASDGTGLFVYLTEAPDAGACGAR